MDCSRQAPLFMGFSRQEYWSGLPFPSAGDLPGPGIKTPSPASAGRFFSAAAAKPLQSCLTLCNPIGSSPPGSPVPGILQARTLEWVAISFSNAWKWKVKVKMKLCPTLRDPMDCSPPGSSVHGIFQARVLEWGAIAFSSFPLSHQGNPIEGSGIIYLKWWKGKTYNQEYSTQQSSCSYLREIKSLYRKAKAKRTQQQQTSFTTTGFWRTAAQDSWLGGASCPVVCVGFILWRRQVP